MSFRSGQDGCAIVNKVPYADGDKSAASWITLATLVDYRCGLACICDLPESPSWTQEVPVGLRKKHEAWQEAPRRHSNRSLNGGINF